MVTRRNFLGASAAALAAGVAGPLISRPALAATPQRFTLNLVNASGQNTASACPSRRCGSSSG